MAANTTKWTRLCLYQLLGQRKNASILTLQSKSSHYCIRTHSVAIYPYSKPTTVRKCVATGVVPVERYYSKEMKSREKHGHDSVVMQVLTQDEPKQLTVGAKVVQAGRDFTYLIAIVAGFGLMGFLFYSVGSEFFSSSSPSTIFTQALKRIKADDRIKEVLGEPITGHGEETGRGRRRHLNYLEYEVDGKTYMRMKFYVSGAKRKGQAVLDLKKNDAGKFELRFLFVELMGYPPQTIILEDNR